MQELPEEPWRAGIMLNPVPKPKPGKPKKIAKSKIPDDRHCWECGTIQNLHRHHIFGGPNRNLSEKYGLVVDLCGPDHNQSNNGVHFNREFDLRLKQWGQRKFEETRSREEFINTFGKSYL